MYMYVVSTRSYNAQYKISLLVQQSCAVVSGAHAYGFLALPRLFIFTVEIDKIRQFWSSRKYVSPSFDLSHILSQPHRIFEDPGPGFRR